MQSASATSQPWQSASYPPILMQANQTSPAAYDPLGNLVNAGLGVVSSGATPALTLGRQYDQRGRITIEIDDSITFYQIPSGGYATNGNVLQIDDALLGNWTIGYDTLNRVSSFSASSGPFQGDYGCWTYDAFGNRTLEALSTTTVTPCAPQANDNAAFSPLTPNPGTNQISGFVYDGAGDVLYDGDNAYAYDTEGRLCEVAVNLTGSTTYYQYLYDAEGRRVAKGSTTSTNCGAPTSGNGFALSNQYLLGLNGEQVTELSGAAGTTPAHTNVWTSGNQLYTYDFVNGGLHFSLHDLVGTKRIQVSGTGVPELVCASLPYGNGIGDPRATCEPYGQSSAPDATEHHFTGKERDSESGNDYFGAPSKVPANPCAYAGKAPDPSVYAQKGQAGSSNAFTDIYNLLQFRRGAALDAQVRYGGAPSYANYTFGVYMSAAGYTLNQTLALADIYAQYRSSYPVGTPMAGPNYPFTPQANVSNITNGFNAQTNGTTCHVGG